MSSHSAQRLIVRWVIAFIASISLCPAWTTAGQTVFGISPLTDRPIAARGGVMMMSLQARVEGVGWPSTVAMEFETGGTVQGQVVWVFNRGISLDRHWTTPVADLGVREIGPDDDSSAGTGRVLLLVDVPVGAAGVLRVLGRELQPVYVDAPPTLTGAQALPRELAQDRPDPTSPFEYWRWTLLAMRLQQEPPPPTGTEVEQRLARYYADLWRIGLARASQNPTAVKQCIEVLTQVCMDHQHYIAAWVTDPDQLGFLLERLLDPQSSAETVAREAREWVETRDFFFFWIERDWGHQVQIAMVNPEPWGRMVQLRWVFGNPDLDRTRIPVDLELASGILTRVLIDRPALFTPQFDGQTDPGDPQLIVSSGSFERRFRVRPRVIPAHPPGVSFDRLYSGLTLADAQGSRAPVPEPSRSTSVQVRRSQGRWELFFECRRPGGPPAHLSNDSRHIARLPGWRDVGANEAVTVFIGPPEAPRAVLTIPEIGNHHTWVGSSTSSGLDAMRTSHPNWWWCRVILPDEWLGFPLDQSTLLGFVRHHADTTAFETAPNPITPWTTDPGRVQIGLMDWQDLPVRFGGQ